MLCYRDRSYCADQDNCATSDNECGRRLTKEESERAIRVGLPIAWMSFKTKCGKFSAKYVANEVEQWN